MASPFLKWAGGKGRLAPEILKRAPTTFNRYIEPFLGGGAIFFALSPEDEPLPALLADTNAALLEAFTAVRDAPAALLAHLESLANRYLPLDQQERAALYYEIRATLPGDPIARAARLIFLNKTCYNGLYRVNRDGRFNVPHGRYVRPRIHDAPGILAASRALANAVFEAASFEKTCSAAAPGDFVYLDPPYQPLSATAKFTNYTRDSFGTLEQAALRDAFDDLTSRGVAALLSNSDHPAIRDLYAGRGYALETVRMGRSINSDPRRRSPISELLISNTPALPQKMSSPK